MVFKGEGGGELEIAGKPMDVGVAGKIIAAIGAEYGQSSRKSISDRGGMEFTIEAGDFPTYIIVWREKWEKGYVTIQHNDEALQVPYLYLTTARPELVNVEYKDCTTGEPFQEETQKTGSSENVSISTKTPTPIPPPTSTPTPVVAPSSVCSGTGSIPPTPEAPPNGCVLIVEWWVPPDPQPCGIIVTHNAVTLPDGAIGTWWFVYPNRPDSHLKEFADRDLPCEVQDLR